MSIRMSCPECEATYNVMLVPRSETLIMKGIEITFDAESWQCFNCKETFDTPESMEANLESARRAYNLKVSYTQ